MATFQPTLPVWGETCGYRGESYIEIIISTHSPRVGRDANALLDMAVQGLFQPTLPVWGETVGGNVNPRDFNISTHSPRVGRDPKSSSARRSVY